ncbi:MAG: NHLP bacteriocin export ABC transporter permease/ATPase subunit [Candidatus Meridianibacter frigidus]|nr:MAG: NHLP bacteriocin export ABC transporter permease/ATPase subunit [Candidatus Eremiobacteraeota bacterium]
MLSSIRSLDVHVPLVCNDPDSGWMVRTGEALFFLTTLKDGAPNGPRHFLGTVPPGEAFFGVALDPQSLLAIIAVGVGLTELEPLPPPSASLDRDEAIRLRMLAHRWLSMLAGAAGEAIFDLQDLTAHAGSKEIADFHARLSTAWQKQLDAHLAAENERVSQEAERDKALLELQVEELSAVLDSRGRDHVRRRTQDALFDACSMVGDALGITIVDPRSRSQNEGDPLRAIARVSRVRYRKITLREGWWQRESGPLLGFLAKTRAPVALLPAGSGYDLLDPISNTRRRVNKAVASTLSNAGFVFYPGFAERALTAWDVVSFAFRGMSRDFLRLLLFGIAAGLLAAATPLATRFAFGTILPSAERGQLLLLTLALVIAALCSTVFALLVRLMTLRIQTRSAARTQNAVWDRLLSLPPAFFREFSAGDLSMRAMAVDTVREIVTGVTLSAILGSLFSLFSFALLFYFSIPLALAACGLLAVAFALTALTSGSQLHFNRGLLKIRGALAGLMLQFLTAVSKLRVAGAELRAFAVWSERFAQEQRLAFSVDTIENRLNVFYTVWPTVTTLVMFAVVMAMPHKISAATFLAFNAALVQFFGASFATLETVSSFLQAIPIFERVRPILETPPEVTHASGDPGTMTGALDMSHVTFRYPGAAAPVIHDVSFHVESGQFVAVVGPSGAGKSSLLRLLLGFDQPESGTVYYDGQDLSTLDVQAVRSQIGIVLQNASIMPGSILENIVGTGLRTLDDAWDAAKKVGLDQEILLMPMGMQTYIMEGGGSFSGGQIQRILIARAIVNRPKILMFDEATSALDNAAQAQVKDSLRELAVTRIVIAHRLSTIVEADRIIVLDGGRIAQSGTFDELIGVAGPFRTLAQRQLA